MSVFEVILAAMLFLQAPGKSIYSQVVVDQNAPPPCTDSYNLLCQPPKWSPEHKGYVVVETYEQGVERYSTIAAALQEVTSDAKWKTPRDRLWRLALTMMFHESGFRRDVHEGIGSAAKGDCDWTGPYGKRVRIPGTCKSHCLGQILLGTRGRTTTEGWSGKDITGLDYESTRKCMYLVVKYIDRAWQRCVVDGGPSAACIVNNYAGGTLRMDDWRLLGRVKTYNKVASAPTELSETVQRLLGIAKNTETDAGTGTTPVHIAGAGAIARGSMRE